MGSRSRLKRVFDSDVKLTRPDLEPTSASRTQRRGFFELAQAQQIAEESSCGGFATFGSRDLDVVEVDDEHSFILNEKRPRNRSLAR
jgi:hypothetical protein